MKKLGIYAEASSSPTYQVSMGWHTVLCHPVSCGAAHTLPAGHRDAADANLTHERFSWDWRRVRVGREGLPGGPAGRRRSGGFTDLHEIRSWAPILTGFLRGGHIVFGQAAIEGSTTHSQQASRLGTIAAGLLKGPTMQSPLIFALEGEHRVAFGSGCLISGGRSPPAPPSLCSG